MFPVPSKKPSYDETQFLLHNTNLNYLSEIRRATWRPMSNYHSISEIYNFTWHTLSKVDFSRTREFLLNCNVSGEFVTSIVWTTSCLKTSTENFETFVTSRAVFSKLDDLKWCEIMSWCLTASERGTYLKQLVCRATCLTSQWAAGSLSVKWCYSQ